jgi:hypothetical protein
MHFDAEGNVRQTFKDIAWTLGKSSVQPQWKGAIEVLGQARLRQWLDLPIPDVTALDLDRYPGMARDVEHNALNSEFNARHWVDCARNGETRYESVIREGFGLTSDELANRLATHHERRMRRIRPWRDERRPRFEQRMSA